MVRAKVTGTASEGELKVFTARQFVEKVREIAARNPAHVYVTPTEYDEETGQDLDLEPRYVDRDFEGDAVGSCLLGCALVELGVEPYRLDVSTMNFDTLHDRLGLGFPGLVVGWACVVQEEQDSFVPWGDSVVRADGKVSPVELELVTR